MNAAGEADSVRRLSPSARAGQPEHAGDGIQKVSTSAYQRIAQDYMKRKKYEKIVPRGYDHNVCNTCELHQVELRTIDTEIGELNSKVLKLQRERKRLAAAEGAAAE